MRIKPLLKVCTLECVRIKPLLSLYSRVCEDKICGQFLVAGRNLKVMFSIKGNLKVMFSIKGNLKVMFSIKGNL